VSDEFIFPNLPLEPIPAGAVVLVTGPGRAASKLARRLTLERDSGHDEGAVLVSTNTSGRSLAADAAAAYSDLDMSRIGIVDATGRADIETDTAARMEAVSGTGDMTGMSIDFSILSSALNEDGITRLRSCFDSLSLLLLYTELRTVIRFTHTLGGRIRATDGFGSFVLDPTMHSPQVEYTLTSVCDGAIKVRSTDGGYEIRTEGLSGPPAASQATDLTV
jgi:KaiC/GvpD/RAD55 family RecA-like ATPase